MKVYREIVFVEESEVGLSKRIAYMSRIQRSAKTAMIGI